MNGNTALLYVDDGYPESRECDGNYIAMTALPLCGLTGFLRGLSAFFAKIRPY